MTPEYKEELKRFAKLSEPVLEWLKNDATNKDDIGLLMSVPLERNAQDYNNRTCGTVCCIAGAIVEFNNIDKYYSALYDTVNIYKIINDFHELGDELYVLFFPEIGGRELGDGELDKITPKQAYITLSNYLKTGIVDWQHIYD